MHHPDCAARFIPSHLIDGAIPYATVLQINRNESPHHGSTESRTPHPTLFLLVAPPPSMILSVLWVGGTALERTEGLPWEKWKK